MKKEYISPLFEEVVLITEDVLTISDEDNPFVEPFDGDYDKEGDF